MKKFVTLSLILIALAALNQVGYADNLTEAEFNVQEVLNLGQQQPASYFNDNDNSPLVSIILTLLNYATGIMGSIGIILFIIAGFRLMFSQGDQTAIDEGKDMFKYTLIGLIVAFLSYVITIFVQSIFIQ